MKSTIELISAIASLWPLVGIIIISIYLFVFRPSLDSLFGKVKKFKSGTTEIELHDNASIAQEKGKLAICVSPSEKDTAVSEPEPEKDLSSEDRPLILQIYKALLDRNSDMAEKLFQELLQKEPANKLDNELLYIELRFTILKDADAVTKFKEFITDKKYKDKLYGIFHSLGRYYETIEQYQKALEYFQQAEKEGGNPVAQASVIVDQARVIAASGEENQALSLLTSCVQQISDDEALVVLFKGIADIHQKIGNKFEQAIALEKVTQFSATDKYYIFKAAYAQSECNLSYLSLHNYIRDLALAPSDSTSRNNYGCQLSEFGLLINAVKQYRKAQEDGETLAMANLASLYMVKGFADDAEKLLKEAQKKENYHGNVDHAMARLRSDREEEDKKLDNIKKWGATYQTFMRSFADGFLLLPKMEISFNGRWKCSDGEELSISQNGQSFITEWGKERKRRKLEGKQINRAAKGKIFIEDSSYYLSSDKPSYSSPRDVLLSLSEDGNVMNMITLGKDEPLYLTFTKKMDK